VNWQGWKPSIENLPAGDYRLTVALLPDFELFAESKEQLEAEWLVALRSHLSGYLAVGKVIPIPSFHLPEPSEVETSTGSSWQVVSLSESFSQYTIIPGAEETVAG
jgi:hypothetical protein